MEKYKNLVGFEGSLLELSNVLTGLGAEDIAEFGNMEEILQSGSMVVAIDEEGENHVCYYFDTVILADVEEESILASEIKITDFCPF